MDIPISTILSLAFLQPMGLRGLLHEQPAVFPPLSHSYSYSYALERGLRTFILSLANL